MSHQAFLRECGRRVRAQRLAAELGVGEAAAAAGISRRTWTEIEAGRANPSLLVLLAVSDTLGTPLDALLAEAEAARLRTRERVALVGLRGAGKSTVGRALARALECPFIELDQRVEELAGMPLAEIFELHDRSAFHRFEAEALESVLRQGERLVVAAGGSIVDAQANFERLRATCRTVWLQATPEEHFGRVLDQGDRRPMADRPRAMEELQAILDQRTPSYARCELAAVTSGRRPADVAEELLGRLSEGA
ncbi:MAG: shikimate kinase [Planctomycetota bacterium]